MMAKLKNIVMAIMLALVFTAGLTGCGSNDSGLLEDYANRPKVVTVLHNNAGYGYQWLLDVSKYYMDNIDTETYIKIKNTPLDAEEGIKLSSGIQTHDVYLLGYTYDYATAGTYLVDLKDVYNDKSTGEDVYVRDKISDTIKESLYPEGTDAIYFLPYQGKTAYCFCYNTTTIDEALGKGNYVLPRTTDELFEFGDRLKEKEVYLTCGAYGDATDYFSVEPWLAQAMGADAYFQARNGKYKNEQGEWVLAEDYPYMISQNAQAYKDVYEVSARLAKSSNNYIHRDSSAMGFLDVEGVLAGVGFGVNKAKVAYHYNGAWLMNEMAPYLEIMEENGQPQTIRAEKIPVISSITRHTPSIKGDQMLRLVIDYIDGKGDKPEGVLDEDIEFVRKARNLGGTHMGGSIAIGKKTENLEGSINFVRFLTTDIAQKIASEALNGMEMLPYGYTPEIGEDTPLFTQDIRRINKDIEFVCANICANDLFMKYGDFTLLPYGQAGMDAFSNEANMITADQYYTNTLNYYASGGRWDTVVESYKRALEEL